MSSPNFFKTSFGYVVTVLFLFFVNSIFAQINVTIDRPDAYYEIGETVTFNITSDTIGTVTYKVRYGNFSVPISEGTNEISAGQTLTVTHQAEEAGVVLCTAYQNGNSSSAAATFSPFEIEAFVEEPTDFDDFWTAQKNALGNIPIDEQLSFFNQNDFSTTYRINLANIDNRRVYGYLTIPNGAGPFPAFVVMPPYGDNANMALPEVELAERGNAIALAITIHNAEPDVVDSLAYLPNDLTDPDKMYYKTAFLAGVRCIDYIFSRADFDGVNLGVTGVSQGAGLATILSGLDNRVKYLIMSNPVLGQNLGLQFDRAGGFPNFIQESRTTYGDPAHEALTAETIKYYDAIYFARRFQGTSWTFISYEDFVTPAATSFAVFNALKGQKHLTHSLNVGHVHPFDYWNKRYDFMRRLVPGALNAPFPYGGSDLGYFIDAGENQQINSGETVNLSGRVERNTMVNPNYNLQWKKITGPGEVNFSTPQNYNTTATFNQNGIYRLQLVATDFSNNLISEQKYYTLMDELEVTVGGEVVNPSDCDNPSNLALNKPTQQSTVQQNGVSERAVDGNTNGDFWAAQSTTLTNWSNQPWWEVDLEVIAEIEQVNIWNRTDCCEEHFKNFYVLVSNEPFASDDLNENLAQAAVTSFYVSDIAGTPSMVNINSTGRYVRIQMEGAGFLSLAEAEVMGCVGGTTELETQEIFFDNISNKTITDLPFSINANATSGLAVNFEVVTGPATVSGNLLTLDGTAGTVIIRASQSGNAQYAPAAHVLRNFEVSNPVISGCEVPVNLALNGQATQSGTQVGATADRAIDGNTDGNFWGTNSVNNTNWLNQAWWEVDLGNSSDIQNINIWNRTDCCTEQLSDFYILVSDVPFVSTDLQEVLNQTGVISYYVGNPVGTPTTLDIDEMGKYVRLQLSGSGFVAMAELEVMGCPNANGFNPRFTSQILKGSALVYPNPADNFIKISPESFKGEEVEVLIFNTLGNLVLEHLAKIDNQTTIELNTEFLESGTYYIKISEDGVQSEVLPITIMK